VGLVDEEATLRHLGRLSREGVGRPHCTAFMLRLGRRLRAVAARRERRG
jgi:hypothetical protein